MTNGSPRPLSIDVFVPVHNVPLEMAARSVGSAIESTGLEDAVTAVLDGPEPFTASELLAALGPDPRLVVLQNERCLGLVANWNRCLSLASRDLVHVLHSDEYVESGFYAAARSAFQRSPHVQLFAACGTASTGVRSKPTSSDASGDRTLMGTDALAQLLGADKPSAAAFVFRQSQERFDESLPYCPDEEFFPRLALEGGYVLDRRSLLVSPTHRAHERLNTWRKPDWVDVYVEARLRHPRRLGGSVVSLAERETTTRVLSVVAYLVGVGERGAARWHLARLAEILPSARRRARYHIAQSLASSPLGTIAVRASRTLMA